MKIFALPFYWKIGNSVIVWKTVPCTSQQIDAFLKIIVHKTKNVEDKWAKPVAVFPCLVAILRCLLDFTMQSNQLML